MASTLTDRRPALERPSLADVCGKPAKADLKAHTPALSLREAAKAAIDAACETQKGAAADIGIDRSRLAHKLLDGTLNLKQLESLGESFAVAFGRELLESYGALVSPREYALRLVDEVEARTKQLRQAIAVYVPEKE